MPSPRRSDATTKVWSSARRAPVTWESSASWNDTSAYPTGTRSSRAMATKASRWPSHAVSRCDRSFHQASSSRGGIPACTIGN